MKGRRLLRFLIRWPANKAVHLACVLGLVALAFMVTGVLLGSPLAVVGSMSVAQGLGVAAALLYGISVAADEVARRS